MTTDRELLEGAAKAAGLILQRSRMDDPMHKDFLMAGNGVRNIGQSAYPWNPLTDDGDALRLAVKLGLLFPSSTRLMHFLTLERFSRQGDNDCVATRRAIVRAAYEIGESMNKGNL